MRIAHVSSTFPPYEAGTGRVCYFNAVELARLGHDVVVFTANHPPGPYDYPPEITVKRLPVWFRVGNAPLLPGLLGIRGFDVIHLHFPFPFGAELVWLASRLWRTPYVITHHNDLISRGVRNRLFKLYVPVTNWLVVRQANKFAVVSMSHAHHCRLTPFYEGRWQDVIEVPNGVDLTLFHPHLDGSPLRDQHHIPQDAQVLLFVGALDRAHLFKNVGHLLEAFERLARPDVWLLIVGDGDMRKEYELQASSQREAERIVFAGGVDHRQLGPYYAACDVVVLPSTPPESFGMVLVEAGACAKPSIASDIPGVRSVVDDGVTGLLTRPGDIDDLVDKLHAILDEPERRAEMGYRARAKIEQTYTWPQAAKKLEELYVSVLN